MERDNYIALQFPSCSVNEGFARIAVAGFAAQLDPTLEELGDIKTAVSEAVTNVIVHAYPGGDPDRSYVYISARLYDTREITVEISDSGCGIEDVNEAMRPSFTTGDTSERCGMGFLVMQSFTDQLTVKSKPGRGTSVLLKKVLG